MSGLARQAGVSTRMNCAWNAVTALEVSRIDLVPRLERQVDPTSVLPAREPARPVEKSPKSFYAKPVLKSTGARRPAKLDLSDARSTDEQVAQDRAR
jgi:hypothetical protein